MAIIQSDPNFQLETNRDHEHDTGISLQHDLNREKQVDKLIFNTNRETIDIEINCNDQNVNITCCPGFYNLVVRPSLLGLSGGFQLSTDGVTFELSTIVPHRDLSGNIQSTVLKFIFSKDNCEHNLSVSLHHTSQKVQIQGGTSMPDGSTSAVFFLNKFVSNLLKSSAKNQEENIKLFNTTLKDLAGKRSHQSEQIQASSRGNPASSYCGVCHGDLTKRNSKAVPCLNIGCVAQMHTKCFRRHSCPHSSDTPSRPQIDTSSLLPSSPQREATIGSEIVLDAINNIDNMDQLERKLYIMDINMPIESFGISWRNPR